MDAKFYQDKIADLSGDPRIIALFSEIPEMDEKTYMKTAYYGAEKEYERFILDGNGIPQGFYTLIEDSIKELGVLKTLKKYKVQIDIICDVSSLTTKDVIILLKLIDENNTTQVTNYERIKARADLREIIRRAIAVHKENYIKERIEEKKKLYKSRLKIITRKVETNKKYIEDFIERIEKDPENIEGLKRLIEEKLNITITHEQVSMILRLSFEKNPIDKIAQLLGIDEEAGLHGKYAQRLTDKFEPTLNAKTSILLNPTKRAQVTEYLNMLVQEKQGKNDINPELLPSYKLLFTADEIEQFEQIAVFMAQCNAKVELKNDRIIFIYDKGLIEQYKKNLAVTRQRKIIKSIQRQIYSSFLKELRAIQVLTQQKTIINQHCQLEYIHVSDEDQWLDPDKIKQLIDRIDISSLSKKEYTELYVLLNKKGLLWAYIAGNISIEIMTMIINNFKAIYSALPNDEIDLDNLDKLIRQANLFDYADNISLAIYGPEVLSKIINYNQFCGVTVTKEVIQKRIRQAVDLAKKAENTPHSSLPYDIDCHIGNYTLSRYRNNDPQAIVCGVETKTCFFISVNDNDFFFYTLLNKNGMIIKITDETGKLIARAACFKNNNVLLLNGIRLYNNQVLPANKNDLDNFRRILALFELMAKKIVESTTSDDCPIDYIVCNKAGLLENEIFDFQYETIDSRILYNPLDTNHPDWDEFVHMYDEEDEQLLQQVPYDPSGFQTDYGNNYPPILIYSRKNMGLLSPRDIKFIDQDPIYERPRESVKQYVKEEIDETIIRKINRIRALSVLNTTQKDQLPAARQSFTLITDAEGIKNLIIGEDWVIILKEDDTYIFISTNNNRQALNEAKVYMNKLDKVARLVK